MKSPSPNKLKWTHLDAFMGDVKAIADNWATLIRHKFAMMTIAHWLNKDRHAFWYLQLPESVTS
jgi:hypothetical protein